ncbi:MAG: hypothetical protein ACJ788_17170, partial [Ktedonobacteraceae bacterium]
HSINALIMEHSCSGAEGGAYITVSKQVDQDDNRDNQAKNNRSQGCLALMGVEQACCYTEVTKIFHEGA